MELKSSSHQKLLSQISASRQVSTAGQLLITEGKGARIVLSIRPFAFPVVFTSTSERHMLRYHDNNLQVNSAREKAKTQKHNHVL
jgi:hypothetical protein